MVDQTRMEEMLKFFGEMTAEAVAVGRLDAETKRNTDNLDLFEAMIREAYDGVTLVVPGHHIMFAVQGMALPGEIASADTLIFNHNIAEKVWGERYKEILGQLAAEPTATRDALLRRLYDERTGT